MRNIISNSLAPLLRTVLPARCPVTGDIVPEPGLLSPTVWGALDFIEAPFCAQCGVRFDLPVDDDTICPACLTEPPQFDRARAVMTYDDHSREMILGFKHGDQTHLIKSFLPWLARAGAELRVGAGHIVPVPLHYRRLVARRYNQAGVMAQALARYWDLPYTPEMLVRTRATASQGHLTRTQRHDNVAGAFAVPPRLIAQVAGQIILLIDDVYTTGATVDACARVLKKAGAAEVRVLTLARVMRAQVL